MRSDQPDLFSRVDAGEAGKKEGMSRGLEHADEDWKPAFMFAIRLAALELPQFTTCAPRERLPDGVETHDNRAIGGCMRAAAKEGWVEKIKDKFELSTIPGEHRRPKQVWRSLLFRGH